MDVDSVSPTRNKGAIILLWNNLTQVYRNQQVDEFITL
jgi:hypothetical protein